MMITMIGQGFTYHLIEHNELDKQLAIAATYFLIITPWEGCNIL